MLDTVIASRHLDDADWHTVLVEVSAPRADGGDWVCLYTITTSSGMIESAASGVDSMQALTMALIRIGTTLRDDPGLTFLGMPQLGFPLIEPSTIDELRASVSLPVRDIAL